MKKILTAILLLLLSNTLIIAQAQPPANALEKGAVTMQRLTRDFYYYVPSQISKNPKLIFVFHGAMGTPEGLRISTGYEFDKLADKERDAIIVYPAGYDKYWNDCRMQATFPPKMIRLDEVAFLGKMIDYFKEKYNIDPTLVFALGHSNGAQLCYKLAKEKPEWFKGIAAISATLPTPENNDCYETHKPVSILVMNGTADPINPYEGGEVIVGAQSRGKVLSTGETIQYWLREDQCDAVPFSIINFPNINTSDNSTAIAYLYKSPTTGKQVELVKIINGGHVIPNPGFSQWSKQLGNVNGDIDAPQLIWDFFKGL